MNRFRKERNVKVARLFNMVFAAHLILNLVIASIYNSSYLIALFGTTIVLASSLLSYKVFRNNSIISDIYAINTIFLTGLVIYLMRAVPESHFHFFISMSFITAFASARSILVALIGISLHHLGSFYLFPGVGFTVDYPSELLWTHMFAAIGQAVICMIIAWSHSESEHSQITLIQQLQNHAVQSQASSRSL